jgi:hypothetical protein
VEFAIVLPVLLLLLLGLVNMGVFVVTDIVLTHAAWEGARAGATLRDPAAGDTEIIGAVHGAVGFLDLDVLQIEIDPTQEEYPRDQPYPMPRGHPLSVRLAYPLTLHLPFAIKVEVRAEAVSRMEYYNPP